jgi:hypothetical protein
MPIRNVEMGEALLKKYRLASTGIFTCLAVLVLLDDDDVFLAHIDSSVFDPSADDCSAEVQKIIEHVIVTLDSHSKNRLIEDVFIIGGVDDDDYKKMDSSLSDMRSDHLTIQFVPKTVSLERFAMFVKKIKYHNLCFNTIDGSVTVDDIVETTWITDILVVCDRSQNPPVVAVCKYVGTDGEMNGDARTFDPSIIYVFDVMLNEQEIFIFPTRTSPFIVNVIETAQKNVKKHSSNRDLFEQVAKQVINDLIPQIED